MKIYQVKTMENMMGEQVTIDWGMYSSLEKAMDSTYNPYEEGAHEWVEEEENFGQRVWTAVDVEDKVLGIIEWELK